MEKTGLHTAAEVLLPSRIQGGLHHWWGCVTAGAVRKESQEGGRERNKFFGKKPARFGEN